MFSHAQTQDGRAPLMMGLGKEGSDGMPRASEGQGRTQEAAGSVFPAINCVFWGGLIGVFGPLCLGEKCTVTPDLFDLWVVVCELR